MKHLNYLDVQIQQLKLLYFKYKESNLLEKKKLVKLLKCSEEMEKIYWETFDLLEIQKIATFGQFLRLVPILLENYSKIMSLT